MLRRFDARNIGTHHSDGRCELLLREPFRFAQLANCRAYIVSSL